MTARRIAFYAPLKPPDHPEPSGDRTIARLTIAALERAGFTVDVVSRLIAYQKRPSPARFETIRAAGKAEARRLINALSAQPAEARPDLWLTYHPYCKAPDWLGPAVSRHLEVPYATLEACRTRQDADEDWAAGRAAVGEAIAGARVNFCLKPSDRAYLNSLAGVAPTIVDIAPFIDVDALPPRSGRPRGDSTPLIVAAGMMRPGKKAHCYAILAKALAGIADRPWRLVIVGDGPARPEVEAAFAVVDPRRIHFAGARPRCELLAWLDRADLFAWPGWREPIGMVYLEAAARGRPVAALASLGVPAVVADGMTGLLAPEGDAAAYGRAIARLLDDPALRRRLGAAGRRHVAERHDIAAASATFAGAFDRLALRLAEP